MKALAAVAAGLAFLAIRSPRVRCFVAGHGNAVRVRLGYRCTDCGAPMHLGSISEASLGRWWRA
jgi:hypothetical protein